METILFCFFSTLYFIKYNWFEILKYGYLAYGLYQAYQGIDDFKKVLNMPMVTDFVGDRIWLLRLGATFLLLLFVFTVPVFSFIVFVWSLIKKITS